MTDTAVSLPPATLPVTAALPPSLQRIVLTGFMGAGKTSVGRLLAAQLGWEFLDLDSHLEARANATVPEIFARHGEQHFRQVESSALANALSRRQIVLALGGGTPEQLTNRLLLEQTPGTAVVFLDAPFSTLYDRCMLQQIAAPGHLRPVLSSPAESEARLRSRLPHYRRLARITIPTAELTPRETAERLLQCFLRENAEPRPIAASNRPY
jgi:shikimate kinase